MIYEYDFTGRKPSIAQVRKQVSEGIKKNASMILISWGENRIDIERSYNGQYWLGSGWIKRIAGSDIAEGLNHA
ncbi:MAG: hypothetical protein EBR60_06880 [Burkholderiaceae bacterium]|nr:hypothetical protein [Burkholderiaceae bacterium]